MQSSEKLSVAVFWMRSKRLRILEYSLDSFNEPCGFSFIAGKTLKLGLNQTNLSNRKEIERQKLLEKLPRIEGKNLHAFCFSMKHNLFVFIKYADKIHTTTSEYGNYLTFKYHTMQESFFTDVYPYHDCPKITHNPKMFSWQKGAKFCYELNACLPKLISKKDQDWLIALLFQNNPMFPVDAIFMGLIKRAQVRCCCASSKCFIQQIEWSCFHSVLLFWSSGNHLYLEQCSSIFSSVDQLTFSVQNFLFWQRACEILLQWHNTWYLLCHVASLQVSF